MAFEVRDARPDDRAGPRLLYLSAQPYYDAYTGSPERSCRMLEAIWRKPGHTAGYDGCRLLCDDGRPVGVLVAFPAEAGDALARRFLAVSLLRRGVWRWPHVLRHLRAAAAVMPIPPERTLYVDALAVDPEARRHGGATALLHDAEATAARSGLRGVSLDTGLQNHAAQALYATFGFTVRGERRAADERAAAAIGGPGFVSYFKPL
jgi:ribosomal protein S18 acetylase RimI-like enzyme